MRSYGERPLSAAVAGLTQNSREEFDQLKRVGRQKVLMTCVSCEKEEKVTQGSLHKYYKGADWRCYDCSMAKKAQDKKEMNQALINLARSKGLIK
jgi:DNA repair protein RadC